MPPFGECLQDVDSISTDHAVSLKSESTTTASTITETTSRSRPLVSSNRSNALKFKPKPNVRSRSVPRLPTLDENKESTTFEQSDAALNGGYLSDSSSSKKRFKSRHDGQPLKTVQQLCADAKKLAHTGEEARALKVYESAIALAGADIGRISTKIRTCRAQHEATRESIQGRLKEDLRRVGILIGKLRTKMAVLYERTGEFDRAIACCKEALEVYKHQPTVNEEIERDKVEDLVELAKNMIEKLESSSEMLIGRDELLLQIEQLRREIARTTSISQKKKLYQKVNDVADQVIAMEIEALGENHSQVAESLQLLSTIALEQSMHVDAIDYLQQAIKISKSCLGMTHPRTGQYYLRLARIYLSQGNEKRALDCFSSGSDFLCHSKKFSRVLGSTFNDVAVIYMRRREFDEAEKNLLDAIHYYERAMRINPVDSDIYESKHCGQAIDSLQVYRNLGDCYMKKMEFEKASEAFLQVLKLQHDGRMIFDKVRGLDLGIIGVDRLLVSLIDDDSIADTLMRLGRSFAAAEKHHEAISYFRKAADLLNQIDIADGSSFEEFDLSINHRHSATRKQQLTNTLYCIAEESCVVGDYDAAVRTYGESMRLRCNLGVEKDHKEMVSAALHCTLCFIGLGNVRLRKEEYAEAYKQFSGTLCYCNRNSLATHPVTSLIKQKINEIEEKLEEHCELLPELEARAVDQIGSEAYESALSTLTHALELRKTKLAIQKAAEEDTTEQVSAIARVLRLFGSTYARLGDKENALRAYSDATKLFKNCGAYEKISI